MNELVRRALVGPIVIAGLLSLAACGDSKSGNAASRSGPSTTSSSTTSSTSVAEETSTTVTSGSTGAASGAGAPAGSGASTPRPGGAQTPATLSPSAATSGTYRYRQSGTATVGTVSNPAPAEGTLVVDPAKPDGSQAFHRVVQAGQSSTDMTLVFRTDGIFLRETVLRNQSLTFSCTFNPPMPSPPWPPATGKAFSGHGECGAFTVDVTGRIEGTRRVTLDGASLEVYVVRSSLTTHGQLESTGTEVDWFAPGPRLLVHTESHQKGTYGIFSFSNDLTSDLISGRPA